MREYVERLETYERLRVANEEARAAVFSFRPETGPSKKKKKP